MSDDNQSSFNTPKQGDDSPSPASKPPSDIDSRLQHMESRGFTPSKALSGSKPSGAWEPPTPEELQAQMPQYKVLDVLGRGGMGAVYKGWQTSLDRYVAIKILPPDIDGTDANFSARFKQEAKTMARLSHPGIIPVFDAGETATGLLYFVMEFVEGTDISRMVQEQGKLSADHALAITAHVCDALTYAHERGVIHRDIKPANIMLNQEGQVKVADFGLAKSTELGANSGLTKSTMTMGTPDFIAPEALIMGLATDHRVDLYAMGVMLYNMLTGEIPRGRWKLPSEKVGSDVRFDAIINKAMETEPKDRYQSAREIRRELDVILSTPLEKTSPPQQQATPAHKPVMQGRRQSPGAPAAKPAASQSPPQRAAKVAKVGKNAGAPRKKSSAIPIFVVGGVFAALAVVGAILMHKPKSPGETSTAATQTVPGRLVNLLPLVDVKRDATKGVWSSKPEGLTVAQSTRLALLELPYEPPVEYDYEVEFTPTAIGYNPSLFLHASGASFAWKMNAHAKTPPIYGFDLLDGKIMPIRNEAVVTNPLRIETGKRYKTRVEVRRDGLRGFVNGTEMLHWTGDFKRLSMEAGSALRNPRALGIGSSRAVIFHRIEVREVSGTGRVMADAGSASTSTPASATKDAPFVNTLGMKFVTVPITGGPTKEERVLFSVWHTRVQDYEVFAKDLKRVWSKPDFEQGPDHPAVNVSWDDAKAFCEWLTLRERATGKIGSNEEYRLPSDHEWSCAAGIGDQEDAAVLPSEKSGKIAGYSWGPSWPPPKGSGNFAGEETNVILASDKGKYDITKVITGYNDGFVYTSPVGNFAANPFGLFDMGGNVQQWCEDWHDNDRKKGVARGASWKPKAGQWNLEKQLTVSFRDPTLRVIYKDRHIGFRCVLAPVAATPSTPPSTSRPTPLSGIAGPIDLLSLIDPMQDSPQKDKWELRESILRFRSDGGAADLRIPLDLRSKFYQIEIEFNAEFNLKKPENRMEIMLPNGLPGSEIAVRFYRDGSVHVGHSLSNPSDLKAKWADSPTNFGHVTVRWDIRNQKQAKLELLRDGIVAGTWSGDPATLSREVSVQRKPIGTLIGLGCSTVNSEIRRFTLTLLEGEASTQREPKKTFLAQ